MADVFNRVTLLAALAIVPSARGQTSALAPARPQEVYDRARASLVIVRYTWASELGPHTIDTAGVVIDRSGVVMCNSAAVGDAVPLKQIQEAKIVVPRAGAEPLELPAEFQGRDDRCDLAYFKATVPHDWSPMSFTAAMPVPGDSVLSVGLLGGTGGYKAVIGESMVAAVLAEGPVVLVDGRLPGSGAVVFDQRGRAIGHAPAARPQPGRDAPQPVAVFVPAATFAAELADRPTPGHPIVTPWLGVADWNGMRSDDAAYYGVNTPAIHVGGVCPGGPLDRAGIKPGQILVGCDAKPLACGDGPDSITTLLRQQVVRMKPGTVVHFDVVEAKDAKPRGVDVTLDPAPLMANTADRFWSDELGLGVRDAVYLDRFDRHLPADAGGVVVTLVRPGGPAEAARVRPESYIKTIGGATVNGAAAFAAALRKQVQQRQAEPIVLVVVGQNGRDETVRIEMP